MITERLRSVIDKLSKLTVDDQDAYAAQLEADLDEAQHIAAQLADPQETDLDYLLARADEQSSQGKVHDLDTIL